MEYLTSREVAQRLKISVRSAQRLIKTLPHIHAGVGTTRETLRISEKVLEEYQTVTLPAKAQVPQRRQIIHHAGPAIQKMERR